MLDYLFWTLWVQAATFLASGDPPMFVRLLALNTLFLVLYAIRRMAGAKPMSPGRANFTQLFAMLANILVLLQNEVQDFMRTLIA